jgi:hypothetical protein
LGASLLNSVEGTHNNPHQLGYQILNVLHHAGEELIVVFYMELGCLGPPRGG